MDEWKFIKKKYPVGSRISGQVREHRHFGFFISIPKVPFKGLAKIVHIKDNGHITPEDYPAIGTTIEAVILGFQDESYQIHLSTQPSLLGER